MLHAAASVMGVTDRQTTSMCVDPLPNVTMSASAEYQAFSQCLSDLTTLLKHNHLSVSSKLLERGLITDDVYSWVLSASGVSGLEKASRLLSCVSTRIKASPQHFHDFVGILSEDVFFKDVVDTLRSLYSKSDEV